MATAPGRSLDEDGKSLDKVATKESRDATKRMPPERTSEVDGSFSATHKRLLKETPLWPYAQAIVRLILKRRHDEKVPWLALVFAPSVVRRFSRV